MLQTKFVEKIKTRILYSITFLSKILPFYETTWKSVVERSRLQMTIWCMRLACWIPKATNTHSQYVILIALPLQQWFLVNDQCNTQIIFYVFISIYNSLHVSSTSCSSSGETNCVNIPSGNSHSMFVAEKCAESSSNLHTSRPPT